MTGRSSDKKDAVGSNSNSSNSNSSNSNSNSNSNSSSSSASDHQTSEAVSLCRQARTLWLRNAMSAEDLDRVEDLYRRALNSKRAVPVASTNKKRKRSQKQSSGTKTKMVAALSPEEYRKAGERLSLLYLQSGRPYKATPGLKYLGFECRLSERILNYPLTVRSESRNGKGKRNRREHKNSGNNGNNGNGKSKMPKPPCCVVDNFLSEPELDHLRKVFGDVDSSYWSSHNYIIDEEPPAPYFSYVIDLNQKQSPSARKGFLRTIIDKILRCGPIAGTFRNLRREARYVELWAHNRPHASGHQLHFDSDDEGRSRQQEFPKHPIASTVLNVSSHSRVGGPTLVTTQKLRNPATTHLSSVKGWLVPSRPARLVCFDGSVLHGVIPGKGTIPPPMDDNENENDDNNNNDDEETKEHRPRRVTLMMAFWKDIEVRTGSKPGSARPWPMLRDDDEASALPPWATELDRTDVAAAAVGSSSAASNKWTDDTERSVIPVSHVYELLDGTPVPKYYDDAEDAGDGPYMPEYDRVFQGF